MSETLDLTSVPTEEPTVTEVVEDVEPSGPEEPDEVATEEPDEVATEEPSGPEEPDEVATEEPDEVATEEPDEVTPVEQVASDIRSILTEVPVSSEVTPEESGDDVVETTYSLKNLAEVLGKWSSGQIRRRNVENLLKESTEVDDNLDDIEKISELIRLWMTDKSQFINNPDNYFLKLDTYELVGESRNLSDEEKKSVLNTLTELSINVSHRRLNTDQINTILNNLYN